MTRVGGTVQKPCGKFSSQRLQIVRTQTHRNITELELRALPRRNGPSIHYAEQQAPAHWRQVCGRTLRSAPMLFKRRGPNVKFAIHFGIPDPRAVFAEPVLCSKSPYLTLKQRFQAIIVPTLMLRPWAESKILLSNKNFVSPLSVVFCGVRVSRSA